VPPVRLYERGTPNVDLMRVMVRNSRLPDSLRGDLDAEVAACRMGAERVADLFRRYGRAEVEACFDAILDRTTETLNPRAEAVLSGERILEMARLAREIPIAAEVRRYGLSLVMATHPEHELSASITRKFVRYGSSPRGAQAMILGAKIRAILDHRYHVAKEDLREMAPAVLRHRLILNFEGQAEGVSTDAVIEEILKSVAQPKMVA